MSRQRAGLLGLILVTLSIAGLTFAASPDDGFTRARAFVSSLPFRRAAATTRTRARLRATSASTFPVIPVSWSII